MNPILHCFSSGIDSTSVLLELSTRAQPVYLLRVNLRRGNRWRAEEPAGDAILAWLAARREWSPARVLHGEWKSPTNSLSDVEVVALFCGDALRAFPDIADIAVSTSLTDRQDSSWEARHRSRVDFTQRIAGRTLAWTTPNWELTRREVIESLPEDVRSLCVFCRMPVGPGLAPCGTCGSCRATLPWLARPGPRTSALAASWRRREYAR